MSIAQRAVAACPPPSGENVAGAARGRYKAAYGKAKIKAPTPGARSKDGKVVLPVRKTTARAVGVLMLELRSTFGKARAQRDAAADVLAQVIEGHRLGWSSWAVFHEEVAARVGVERKAVVYGIGRLVEQGVMVKVSSANGETAARYAVDLAVARCLIVNSYAGNLATFSAIGMDSSVPVEDASEESYPRARGCDAAADGHQGGPETPPAPPQPEVKPPSGFAGKENPDAPMPANSGPEADRSTAEGRQPFTSEKESDPTTSTRGSGTSQAPPRIDAARASPPTAHERLVARLVGAAAPLPRESTIGRDIAAWRDSGGEDRERDRLDEEARVAMGRRRLRTAEGAAVLDQIKVVEVSGGAWAVQHNGESYLCETEWHARQMADGWARSILMKARRKGSPGAKVVGG